MDIKKRFKDLIDERNKALGVKKKKMVAIITENYHSLEYVTDIPEDVETRLNEKIKVFDEALSSKWKDKSI